MALAAGDGATAGVFPHWVFGAWHTFNIGTSCSGNATSQWIASPAGSLTLSLNTNGAGIIGMYDDGYQADVFAPGAGTLTVKWYHRSGGAEHLVASGKKHFAKAGSAALKIVPNSPGKTLLHQNFAYGSKIPLTAVAIFKSRNGKMFTKREQITLR